jgi:predicted neuraminidase
MIKLLSLFLVTVLFTSCTKTDYDNSKMKHLSIINEEFIYEIEDALTPQCHASTIAASGDVILAAWFGGTEEKNDDVGIWVSSKVDDKWSIPAEVVNGIQEDGSRFPCWNPVLFQPNEGPLFLFYKVGPSPKEWWGLYVTSNDDGKSWSEPITLPEGIYGPIKNKSVQLANGDILSPTSTEHDGWKVQIERSTDLGKTWTTTGDLNDGVEFGAIQPSILIHPNNTLQILNRTKNEVITDSWSYDSGLNWSKMESIGLPNPNSGIDAVTLEDGRHLLVYNPTDKNWGDRVPLSIAISDDGKGWQNILDLEPITDPETVADEEYSYPSVIQTSDGLVHVVYTWNRKTVKYVVLDPTKIK